MKILIIGLGRMGYALARQLDGEGHNVYAIDSNRVQVERARQRLDIMVACGSGCSLEALRSLGVEGADLAIAVSGSDEINIVSSLVARELSVKRCIARIESRELADNLRQMPLDRLGLDEFINPREQSVQRMLHIIQSPGTTMKAEFAGGKVQLRGLRVTRESQLTGLTLIALQSLFAEHFLVPAVQRNSELIVPKGDFQIKLGDVIHVLLRTDIFDQFLDMFEFERFDTKKVFVYGAEGAGLDLCHELEKNVRDVILLEESWELRKSASAFLQKTTIIDGSPRDKNLMQDLNISAADFFVGASESEEANFSSALMAKKMGARMALMLTDHPEHVELFDTLPLDAVVSPAITAVSAILKLARTGSVLSMFSIAGGRGEALEIQAGKSGRGIGKALKEVKFPEGVMIAGVTRHGEFSIASGRTVLHPDDQVIVVARRDSIRNAITFISG